MINHLAVFARQIIPCVLILCRKACRVRQAVVRSGIDFTVKYCMNLIKMIGVKRITLGVAPGICKRHFAGRIGHNRVRLAVLFKQLKSVFLGKGLHILVVVAVFVFLCVFIARKEIGEARNVLLLGVAVLVLRLVLLFRQEIDIFSVNGVVLRDKVLCLFLFSRFFIA